MTPTEVDASIRRYVVVSVVALAVLVLGFGLWATTARITGAIIAAGKVEVESNRQVVQHPAGGVVSEILVEDGEYVEAGQLLLRLDVLEAQAELLFMREQLFDLKAKKARLVAETRRSPNVVFPPEMLATAREDDMLSDILEEQRHLFASNISFLDTQLSQLESKVAQERAKIEGALTRIEATNEQLNLLSVAISDQQDLLRKGLSPGADLFALQREKAVLLGNLGQLRSAILEAREHISELDSEKLLQEKKNRSQSAIVLRETSDLLRTSQHRIGQITASIAAADIRAPVSGIVYQRAVHTPRAVVQAAEPLMYLIPQDRPRIIVAELAPQHIDEVRIGQDVRLRLSALNARTTPEVFGRITAVSADAIEDQVRGGYYYRVDVELNDGELDRLPEGSVLLPGMPVETFIETGARTPLAYLVKPITDYLAHAMREG